MTEQKLRFRDVFNLRDPDAKARICMLISTCITSSLNYFISGIFYNGFLSGYGMKIEEASFLSIIPTLAGLAVVFTPGILTRFPKRKWVLGTCKFLYYLFIFVLLTALPSVITDSNGRLIGMTVFLFFANVCNVFATAGYAAWHIRFMPEHVRSYYLSFSLFFGAFISGVLVLASGVVSDLLADMAEKQLAFIVILRYVAFLLGLLDVICLMIPHEVDYPLIKQPKFTDIVSIPLRNRKFMMTMVVVFGFQFAESIYNSSLTFYLLNTIHVSYAFYNFIIFAYSVFFIAFMSFWRKKIDQTSWFGVFAVGMIIVGPLQILYGFIRPGIACIVILLLVRLPQHFAGVGHNTAFANFQYINMPDNNRTCYSSFYQIVLQVAALLGTSFATFFHKFAKEWSFTLFDYTYEGGMPWLLFMSGTIELLLALYISVFKKHLEPDTKPQQN